MSKTKYRQHGDINKYKARLLVKGYRQKYGIDCTKKFLHQSLDLNHSFSNSVGCSTWNMAPTPNECKVGISECNLKERVYIDQPERYIRQGHEHKV